MHEQNLRHQIVAYIAQRKNIPIEDCESEGRRGRVVKWQNDTAKSLSLAESRNSAKRQSRVFVNGIGLAQLRKKRKKGGEITKNFKSNLSILLVVGVLGTSGAALAADGVLLKEDIASDSYCHTQFPAIRESTLGDDQPQLKDSSTGDVIDFYGPCDEDPLGKDQVHDQRIENQHRLDTEYSSEWRAERRIVGKNILIEFRTTGGKSERRPELAAELVRLKVDVIGFDDVHWRGLLERLSVTDFIYYETKYSLHPIEP
jgi:hypothetical protein